MRKLALFIGIISILLGLNACENSYNTLVGEYHYQASGHVTLGGVRDLIIDHEKGSLEIIQKDATTLMLIFFAEDGNTYTTHASIENKNIMLDPFYKLLTVNYYTHESTLLGGTSNVLQEENYQVAVYGTGELFANTIILTLQYKGEELNSGTTLVGKNITLIAKKK